MLAILVVSLILFLTELIRMDLVALLVLGSLALTGLVSPEEAFSGFSNPAVVAIWAMFILSEGLSRTGVADQIGKMILRLTGTSEARTIIVIMVAGGGLSAFMNNIGVAALLLPVVMDIARKTGRPPSRLLMPLAFGTLLGGLTTLIGTPPNLLVSTALRDAEMAPFGLFDYTPVGLCVMVAGILFVAFVGRHFLPKVDPEADSFKGSPESLREQYALGDITFVLRLERDSLLAGNTLAESRLGSALGLHVIALVRDGRTRLAPEPATVFRAGDRLVAQGRMERLDELQGWREFAIDPMPGDPRDLLAGNLSLAQAFLKPESSLTGKTLAETDFRNRFGVNVLLIRKKAGSARQGMQDPRLQGGDRLLLHGPREKLDLLEEASSDFENFQEATESDLGKVQSFAQRIFEVAVPEESFLAGKTLAESRLGDAFGLRVLAIARDGEKKLLPGPEEKLQAGDLLTIHGRPVDLKILRGLQELKIEGETSVELRDLDSEKAGMIEAVLAPRSNLAGKTPRSLHFREKYGLQILAIWREGKPRRSNLRDIALRFGDALLLMGPGEKLDRLAEEPDFLILTRRERPAVDTAKGPLAAIIMMAVLIPVLAGYLPISLAAVCGAAMMVLTGCLKMEEAYQAIEWRAVFLIAGMLPLGLAMHQSGAAEYLAGGMVAALGDFGRWPVLMGLYLVTAIATTVIPTSALVVLMAPIVLKTCADMGISPYAGMMAIAVAASASFTSPISHPANILVMGPGGYRFIDYLKLGVPLSLVTFVVVMLTLPFFWPI